MFKGMKPTKKIEHCNYNTKEIRGKIKKCFVTYTYINWNVNRLSIPFLFT